MIQRILEITNKDLDNFVQKVLRINRMDKDQIFATLVTRRVAVAEDFASHISIPSRNEKCWFKILKDSFIYESAKVIHWENPEKFVPGRFKVLGRRQEEFRVKA